MSSADEKVTVTTRIKRRQNVKINPPTVIPCGGKLTVRTEWVNDTGHPYELTSVTLYGNNTIIEPLAP